MESACTLRYILSGCSCCLLTVIVLVAIPACERGSEPDGGKTSPFERVVVYHPSDGRVTHEVQDTGVASRVGRVVMESPRMEHFEFSPGEVQALLSLFARDGSETRVMLFTNDRGWILGDGLGNRRKIAVSHIMNMLEPRGHGDGVKGRTKQRRSGKREERKTGQERKTGHH